MQLSNRSELMSVMTELWILLDTLTIVEPDTLQLQPSDICPSEEEESEAGSFSRDQSDL
jgi:hypothetical protein